MNALVVTLEKKIHLSMSYDCDHTNAILSALKGKPWGNNQIE